MTAMNPFFMAQHMAQAVAMNTAAVVHAATSGGGTTAGTGHTATTDTANSDEVQQRKGSAAPGSPGICKPEPQLARRGPGPAPGGFAAVGAMATTAGDEAPLPCAEGNSTPLVGGCMAGSGSEPAGGRRGWGKHGSCTSELASAPSSLPPAPVSIGAACVAVAAGTSAEECVNRSFQTSTYSAFRPPQVSHPSIWGQARHLPVAAWPPPMRSRW
jgi:hypothetical protein